MLYQFHLTICDALDESIKFDVQCWILCTYSALQISYFEVICSSVFFTMNKHDQKWYFEVVVYFILPILYNVVLKELLYIFHSAISNNNLAKWTCI